VLRRWWVLLAAVVLLATAATATNAYAAKITLTSKTLLGIKSAANALPAQLVYDSFTGTTKVNINTRAADTGQSWRLLQATMQLSGGGYLQCTTGCATNNYGAAIINAEMAKVTATVDVRSATGSGPAGLIMNANSIATQAYAVWYDAGQVTLLRYDSGTVTYAPVQTVSVPPNNTDVPLSVVFNGTTYAVSFNSINVMNYTLPTADQAIFGSNTYFGVVIYNDANVVRLDDFVVKQ
jgi:hypothetical protein